jgi:hypothetical protein
MERKTKKLERKRLVADQPNAQPSTDPQRAETEASVSRPPGDVRPVVRDSVWATVKTALTGRTLLLPAEDAAEYERHLAAYVEEFAPVGPLESNLLQSIADTGWRLRRIPALEMALFAKGHLEFGELFDKNEIAARPLLIDAHTFIVYEKQIHNLQLQEARLARRRSKEIAELLRMQSQRIERIELQTNQKLTKTAVDGFVFSTLPLEHYLQMPGQATLPQKTLADARGSSATDTSQNISLSANWI